MNNNTAPTEGQNSDQTGNLAGSSSHDLLAFSSILGGLLASGHYTEKPEADEYGDIPHGLITDDYGKEWREDTEYDPRITRRYMPIALQTAEMLWKDMKKIIQANSVIE